MKQILQIFVLIIFLFTTSYGAIYKNIKNVSLKKDEQKKILVKYGNSERLFTFRWTLYINEGLVVFHSYDKIKKQNVLYLNNQNRSFMTELKSRGSSPYDVARLLVKFKKFDVKEKKVTFELFIADEEEDIGIEFLKND